MSEHKLPSGAELKITVSPFKEARALYQACLDEAKVLKIDAKQDIDVNLFKDLFCAGLSSKKIESALWDCMKRVTYNGLKVTEDIFEPVEAREDYFEVCFLVAKENLMPFMKSLSPWFSQALASMGSIQR